MSFFRRKRSDQAVSEERSAPGTVVTPRRAGGEPEESSPLAERLRSMDWPTPPDEVRERCLREIMSRVSDIVPPSAVETADETPGDGSQRAAG